MTADPAHFVADPVEHRLAEIRLHRADVTGLEDVDAAQHLEDGVLDDVVGVEVTARNRRQPTVRPSPEPGQAPLEKGFQRRGISLLRLDDELDRRLLAVKHLEGVHSCLLLSNPVCRCGAARRAR